MSINVLMKRFTIYLIAAVSTFLVGVFLAAFWFVNRDLPTVPPPQTQKLYESNLTTDSHFPESQRKFYETILLPKFEESPLQNDVNAKHEVYRLVLLPTFDDPIAIRLWKSNEQYFLTVKKAVDGKGMGMERFGKLYENTKPVTRAEWNEFINHLEEAMFWDLPSRDKDDIPVNDGASWTLEGKSTDRYHIVDRITPSKELKESCLYLLKLSGFEDVYKDY